MPRKKATVDELDAHAEAEWLLEEGRTGKKIVVERGNKHEDTTKKYQDITLDHDLIFAGKVHISYVCEPNSGAEGLKLNLSLM
jgi:hypothetical protein